MLSKTTTPLLLQWKPNHPQYNDSLFSDILEQYTDLNERERDSVTSELKAGMDHASVLLRHLTAVSTLRDRMRAMTLSQMAQRKNCPSKGRWESALRSVRGFDPPLQDYLFVIDLTAFHMVCAMDNDDEHGGVSEEVVKLFAWFLVLEVAFPSYYAYPWRKELFGPLSPLLIPFHYCTQAVINGPLGVASRMALFPPGGVSDVADKIRDALLSTLTSYLTRISSIGNDLKKNLRLQNITFGFPQRVVKYIDEELREFKFDFSAKGYLASLSAVREAYHGPLAWLFVTGAARLSDSPSTNAVFYGPRREVYLPPGLLSPPVFYSEGPPAYNYALVGH
ncbi:hypothetical protein MTO96_032010, partial [Rhipicephalus appendiculatus]